MRDVVVAEVVRSGFVESVHHGRGVVLDPAGDVVLALGDPGAPVFPRSAAKPLQAVALLTAGLDLPPPLLALAAASHSGAAEHLAGVARILALGGFGEDALAAPPDLPLGVPERQAWLAAGRPPSRSAQNCSGQHAAMLVTCARNGWDPAGYLDPDGPLQTLVTATATVADAAGQRPAAVGVDGCGAPTIALSPVGLARAFAALAVAPAGSPYGAVAAAVRAHPELLGGAGRPVTRLLRGLPGLVAKDGAEGVFAAALPSGAAVALKVADGGTRAVWPVAAALLRVAGADGPVPAQVAAAAVHGGGTPVGTIRAVLPS